MLEHNVPYPLEAPMNTIKDSGSTPASKICERKYFCFYSIVLFDIGFIVLLLNLYNIYKRYCYLYYILFTYQNILFNT